MKHEDDIQGMFIVDQGNYHKEVALASAKMLLEYAKVSKNGDIIIINNSLSPDDKLRVALSARFIAHSLVDEIASEVSLKDLSAVLSNESKEAVGSRMSKLVKDGFAKKGERGVYMAHAHMVGSFLEGLSSNLVTRDMPKLRSKSNNADRKMKATGVGKDILDLINEGFFKTPKTIKEIEEKLKTEVKFHDARVIDMAIRKTFVKSRKQLKRIPNTDKGKARWQYVVR